MSIWLRTYVGITMAWIVGVLLWQLNWSSPDAPAWVQAVGSVVAIVVAVLLHQVQSVNMRMRDKERDNIFIYNAVRAMGVEIAAHVGGIGRTTQSIRDARDSNLMNTFVDTKVTFPVFENCAGTLGNVDDPAIQAAIIQHYRWLTVFYDLINELSVLSKKYSDGRTRDEDTHLKGMQSAAINHGEVIVNLDCKPILDDYLRTLRRDHID